MIQVIYISDSNKHFDSAIQEYLKRLTWKVKLVKLKPTKWWETKIIIDKDTQTINNFLKKQNGFNILLSLDWKQFDSLSFAKFLGKKMDYWENINFIIWGAFWLDETKLEKIDYKIKLSDFTFPHSLALLLILEQVYRALQIIWWRKYHY